MLLSFLAGLTSMIQAIGRLSVVVLTLSCSVMVAAEGDLAGTVLDSEGAAIAKAHIVIHADASGRRAPAQAGDLIALTDRHGHFSASLTPGFYDVCVMADAFSPSCEKVFIDHSPVALKVQLKADPKVMERLGDKF